MEKSQRIAIVRVRGRVGVNPNIHKTLKLLRLYRKNYCIIVPNKPELLGMLRMIKDYTTFGELDVSTFIKLLQKRGRLAGKKPLTENYLKEKTKLDFKEFSEQFLEFKKELKDIPGLKLFFRLHPPIGGFERKGVKQPYSVGGVLGYRSKDINKLIMRMI